MRIFVATQDSVNWASPSAAMNQGVTRSARSTTSPATLEELKRRATLLTDNNHEYTHIKEKLVGQTLYYQPHIEEIVPCIVAKCSLGCCHELNKKIILNICEYMTQNKCYNLRTLQYSLSFFKRVMNDLEKQPSINSVYDDILLEILEDILTISIYYKDGGVAYAWDEASQYGRINLKKTFIFSGYKQSFRFVHDYIYGGIYDADRISTVFQSYTRDILLQKEKNDNPINTLCVYWELEDAVVESEVQRMFAWLSEGKYDGSMYRYILSLLYTLKGIGFESICVQKYIEIIENNISSGMDMSNSKQPCISEDSKYFNEYSASIEKLMCISTKAADHSKKEDFNSIFAENDCWGEKFYTCVQENYSMIMSARGLFRFIDINTCMTAIESGTAKDISFFRQAIYSTYDSSNIKDYLADDATAIDKLIEKLDSTCNSKTKQFNIDLLRSNLRQISARLNESDRNI